MFGETAFIFYLKILNLSPKSRRIKLPDATYVTQNSEQLEQDKWLSGLLICEGNLKANAFVKAGLVFYKSNIKQVSNNDTLYVNIELLEERQKVELEFQKQNENWNIINTEITEMESEIRATAKESSTQLLKELATQLLKRVERLEAFEENCKVYFDKISINITDNYGLQILGEAYPSSGSKLEFETIIVNCILYDKDNQIIDKEIKYLFRERFFGFEVFVISFRSENILKSVHKIRLYPSRL